MFVGSPYMSVLKKLWSLLTGERNELVPSLDEWFAVEFDEEAVRIDASPPGRKAWQQEFRWNDIERVCFKAETFGVSDAIYVFTKTRPESYVIPTEAKGGAQFWENVIFRGLFDAELAVKVASAEEGMFCWPPVDQPEEADPLHRPAPEA